MQVKISSMKQTEFSEADLLKAMAIVNIFETGEPFGDFAACVVLNDGAGISYGISQFTHRSGSLAAVVERYLELDGSVGRDVLEDAVPNLRRNESAIVRSMEGDERLKKALRTAGVTREMREAQLHVAVERYLKPAIDACAGSSFVLPLSLAVIYDSTTHGSFARFRDHINGGLNEKAWITEYVRTRDRWLRSVPRLRTTRYRTQFFLSQIMTGGWELELPLLVHGFRLEDHHIRNLTAHADGFLETAVGPNLSPHKHKSNTQIPQNNPQIPASTPQAQPPPVHSTQAKACTPNTLDVLEGSVNCAVAKFDQADRILTGVVTRTDRAKSLWTTVIGTIWQTAWAVFGIIAGLPREVWLVVAVIAALLTLLYLYRQIALGKLRERGHSCPHERKAFENVGK